MNEFLEICQGATIFEVSPLLGIILTAGLAAFKFHFSFISWFFGISWIGLVFMAYYTYVRKRERKKKLSPVVMEQSVSLLDENRYRILVPISKLETAEELIDFAALAAKVHNADLLLVHAIEQQYLRNGRNRILTKAREMAADRGIKASAIIRLAKKPSKAIIDTVEEYGADMVVMGWKGTSSYPNTVIGSNIDKVMRDADCDVLVLKGKNFRNIKKVLIPISNPKESHLKLELGEILDTSQDTDIDLYHMISSELNNNDKAKQERLAELYQGLAEFGQGWIITGLDNKQDAQHMINIEVTDRIPHSIIKLSSSYDLTIIEAASEGWFQNLVAATRAELIAKRARGKFILVKQNESVRTKRL